MKLEFELILVDAKSNSHKSANYLALNPAGRIPTLVTNGQPIFESPAICIHLCEQHPEHELIPALGSAERPLFFQWLTYLNNTLQAELMVYHYPERHTNKEDAIPNVVSAQGDRIADALSLIDAQLADHPYLVGDKLTACDFFMFMLAEWSLPVEKNPMSFKHLAVYLNKLTSHPTIKAVCELEGIDLTPFK
jgi:glutathione S-transferase